MADPLFVGSYGGVEEWLHTTDGVHFSLERRQDVEAILEDNKRQALANPSGMGASREWQKVASIPIGVQFEWIKRYGADPLKKGNEDLLKRLLNDPEWRYLRCSEVIV